ncbi:MAG: hypothetical protein H0V20_02270 [Actinobacteria bacterium]|nr:hypothetical protein [Actinomycetota bacterium]
MRTCENCGRRRRLETFSRGRRVCRECRAEAERERRRLARPALDDEERERFAARQVRMRREHEETNAMRRLRGWPELAEPDLEPGWLEPTGAGEVQAAVRRW